MLLPVSKVKVWHNLFRGWGLIFRRFPKVDPWTGQPWALGRNLFEIEIGREIRREELAADLRRGGCVRRGSAMFSPGMTAW